MGKIEQKVRVKKGGTQWLRFFQLTQKMRENVILLELKCTT